MTIRVLATALGACLLVACAKKGGDENAAPTPPVLAGVPLVPGSQIVENSGTSDAARLVVVVSLPTDSVAAFYRRELAKAGWRLVSDVPDSSGTDLLAQRDGPPLWVQIRPGPSREVTRYTVIGAVGGKGAAPAGAKADSGR